jgi:hypothetical protein
MALTLASNAITFTDNTSLSSGIIGTAQLSAGAVTADKIASGAITANKIGYPGCILQVLQTVKSDTFSTTSTSWIDVPGLSATITLASTNSKILVMCSGFGGMSGSYSGALRLMRNNSAVYTGNTVAGYTSVSWANFYGGSSDGNNCEGFNITYLDSPNSIAQVEYKVQAIIQSGGTLVINGNGSDLANQTYSFRGVSSITLMEVSG